MSNPCDDAAFLERELPVIRQPLAHLRPARVRRVLFAPGAGLGLGDQFLCLALAARLADAFRHAQIDLLTDYESFWGNRSPVHVRPVAYTPGETAVPAVAKCGYDVVVAGYFPGALAAFSEASVPTAFGAGKELGAYRMFYAKDGQCSEIPLDTCCQAVGESAKFHGLFDDIGVRGRSAPCEVRHGRPWGQVTRGAESLEGAYILIHPCSAKPYKEWPAGRWTDLTRRLVQRGSRVTVSSGVQPREAEVAKAIVRAVPEAVLLPRLPFDVYLTRMGRFDAVCSGDTFVTHAVAHAGNSLSLAIYGPTDPLRFCPPTAQNFFVTPFDLEPAAYADALDGLLALHAGSVERLAHGPGADAVLQCAGALAEVLAEGPPSGALAGWRAEVELLVRHFALSLQPMYRDCLVGPSPVLQRFHSVLRHRPIQIVAQYLQQMPFSRSAPLLGQAAGIQV